MHPVFKLRSKGQLIKETESQESTVLNCLVSAEFILTMLRVLEWYHYGSLVLGKSNSMKTEVKTTNRDDYNRSKTMTLHLWLSDFLHYKLCF